MSFFDKFFNHKSISNKTENELNGISEPLSFKSSNLHISKDQIRFILFRECDRRGRKLLFDSTAVEKIPLPVKGIINCTRKFQQGNKKSDFIETTATHGYKYKKLSDDVPCLGEMIFGSVAMTYKGENSCKIHKIPSPRQLMFTTIIHAPIRCHVAAMNECSLESSLSSNNGSACQKETSSDSKLYMHTGDTHKCSSTYPCIRNAPALDKLTQCCDVSDERSSIRKQSFLNKNNREQYIDRTSLCNQEQSESNHQCQLVKDQKLSSERIDFEKEFLMFNLSQKSSGCERNSSSNLDSTSSFASSESENVSSVSGSLSSLRRRWAQSCSTSLDTTAYEDINSTPCKKRAKLGMALILDIGDSKDDKMENFLFSHTILIDSIMSKLQSSVELAYIKTRNFVDLIYTAFLDTQQSIYEFITGGKYTVPLWLALTGDPGDNNGGDDGDNCATLTKEFNPGRRRTRACSREEFTNRAKIKFLNDFHDVLVKFETKDTNFFISTLLTAVLTHHLSWVTGIAETDLPNRQEKMQSVIKNYNPIWAQLNDLYGLLGSPLKCAKTIVRGCETKKTHIAAILQILTYFIRCFNVIENVYDVNLESIVGGMENSAEISNFNRGFEAVLQGSCRLPQQQNCNGRTCKRVPVLGDGVCERTDLEEENPRLRTCSVSGQTLKRNKACFSKLKLEGSNLRGNACPKIGKGENVEDVEEDLDENSFPVGGNGEATARCPKSDQEGYLSADEGYDTIDSSKTASVYAKKLHVDGQTSSALEPGKNEIVFILGENDELVNLNRKVVLTKSDVIELESEDFRHSNESSCESATKPADSGRVANCQMCACRTLANPCNYGTKTPWNDPGCCQNGVKTDCCPRAEVSRYTCPMTLLEIGMPSSTKPCRRKHLEVSPVFGGVNQKYNSEQIVQGVIDPENHWEQTLHKDLFLCAYNSTVEKDVSEALCIVGDVDSWEVSVRSSNTSSLDRNKHCGVRVGMSQLVADMLESFLHLHKINLPPNFCLLHIEKKLREIYLKSKTVAELLSSTDLCTIDYLTTRLDIGINDIPLLLSVATTHSPQISERYGLSFT